MNLGRLLPGEKVDRERLEALLTEDTSGACGITAVQSAQGATREVVDLLLRSVCDNDIRAGKIREKRGLDTGDGVGMTLRTDNDRSGRGAQEFLRSHVGRAVPITKPKEQLHGSIFFIDSEQRANTGVIGERLQSLFAEQGFAPLSWKPVKTNPDAVSSRARAIMPLIWELIYAEGDVHRSEMRRTLFDTRFKVKERVPDTHPVSLQPGTMTWKAMARGQDLANFYPDLRDPKLTTDGGISHTRFGTNVLAHWLLAQPFDLIAHNGEVNNIQVILEALYALERRNALPGSNIMRGGSDSANTDRAFQMLHARAGLSLQEAVRFLVHPAQDDLARMDPRPQAYFRAGARAHGSLKPVGPIALIGIDSDHTTATLDSMGLRPLRWVQRDDGLVVISSEVGSPRIPSSRIVEYGKVGPGEHMFLDRDAKFFRPGEADEEIVARTQLNFEEFVDAEVMPFSDLRARHSVAQAQEKEDAPKGANRASGEEVQASREDRVRRAHLFGLNKQRLIAIKDTVEAKKDPVDGMGSDLAIAALVPEPHSLARYLRPNYAQVTNPSLDPIRNRGAFSLRTYLGRKPKQVELGRTYQPRAQFELDDPFLDEHDMKVIYRTDSVERPYMIPISTVFSDRSSDGLKTRLSEIKEEILRRANRHTHSIIVLTDRTATGDGDAYIPPHLAVSYLKRVLADEGLSEFVSFIVDTGEVIDQHEYATLIACGADAVHPRMLYELIKSGELGRKKSVEELAAGAKEAFNFTLLRYMSKLGITEIDQYRGGRYFSTLGLDTTFVNRYFGDIPTNGSGFGLERILGDQMKRADLDPRSLRGEDERHAYVKAVWSALQQVGESKELTPEQAYAKYLEILRAQGPLNFRDLLRFKMNGASKRKPIPLNEVMSREEIIKHILRGASMSLGALNEKSHMAVNLLFNLYGSYASSGEGGVSPKTRRGEKWENATSLVRQIASGRFGVDIEYLADPRVKVIEIKVGQGAKPGVGGHLPGEKVAELVAEVRGVGLGQELISPPTNHNIYSIEDLEAFIGHLKACNPAADVSVKITAGANVGNIAVGCVKAGADVVQVSGDQGGTGAATQTDKFNTGLPTELGVSNVDRALIERGLRDRVRIGADGGIRNGRDVLMSLMLGADEVALGTSVLIAQQKCVFCSNCSFQTCPSDITRTRSDFLGEPKNNRVGYPEDEQMDRLIKAGSHFLELMAEEIREYMAQMGLRDIDELIGRRDLLEVDPKHVELASHFDMKTFLDVPEPVFQPLIRMPTAIDRAVGRVRVRTQQIERVLHPSQHDKNHVDYYLNHPAVNDANRAIIRAVNEHGYRGGPAHVLLDLTTSQRSVGATLSGLFVKRVLSRPHEGVVISSSGEAGQGFAYAIGNGITMRHYGPVQNETAEIQSGGRVVVMPPQDSPIRDRNNLPLVGNTLGYGARGGDRFMRASVGDRCCIRETGGRTIISGDTGKYFAEYKTGGRDIVLGKFSGEVGPGMSGGSIYARDPELGGKISKDTMLAKVMRKRDLDLIRQDLAEFYLETSDFEVKQMLDDWDTRKHEFKKVVSNGKYATQVFQYLYRLFNNEESLNIIDLASDLLEMCGYDMEVAGAPFTVVDVERALEAELHAMQGEVAKIRKQDPEQIFMFIRGFAVKATERIKEKFTPAVQAGADSPAATPQA